MPDGAGGKFTLEFCNCRKWHSIADLVQPLYDALLKFNLRVLVLPSLRPLTSSSVKEKFVDYCYANYETREGKWDENYYPVHAEGGLTLRFEIPFLPVVSPPVWDHLLLSSSIFGQEYNTIKFSMDMGSRHHDTEIIREYQNQLISLYSEVSRFLIPRLFPDYVWIGEDDEKYERLVKPKYILKKEAKYIYWANYYDLSYLAEEAKKIFDTAPVGKSVPFGDGFWYYLHDDFNGLTDEEVMDTEYKAMTYFSKYFDIQWVQWRFFPA